MKPAKVALSPHAALAIRRGHPWVWRATASPLRVEAGAVVSLADGKDTIAEGIADPDSPIAVRVWARAPEHLDDGLVRQRIDHAFSLRDRWFADGSTTAFRLLHGEGDRCPGYVIDRYDRVAVLQTDGHAAEARLDRMRPILEEALRARGIETLLHRARGKEPHVLFGSLPEESIRVREHGVPFAVDVIHGQKTGAFLDQRDNRRRVRTLAEGRTVLNLFSYAAGFSLSAALGGATTTSVDIAAKAHATAQANFRLNGLTPADHEFVTADAFAFLAEAARKRRTWDVIVSDPPSFAPNEKSIPRAMRAYKSLHRACAEVLAPGGTFCASSCSSHVPMESFLETLDDDTLGRADLRVVEMRGQPVDHPTLAAWPEGRYLKFVVLA